MLTPSFNTELNILEIKASGSNRIEDILKHYKDLSENTILPKKLCVLIDSRNSIMDINPEELSQVNKFLIKVLSNFNFLHEAILVDKPYETAIAALFEKQYDGFDNYKFKVFSTLKAALDWLSDTE